LVVEPKRQVWVCQHINCQRHGSADVLQALQSLAGDQIAVCPSGCLGQCSTGPTVHVIPDQVWYCRVEAEDAIEIAEQHFQDGQPVERLLHPRFHTRYY